MQKFFILMVLLFVCSSCVSRTVTEPDSLTGTGTEVVEDKLIWFWQPEFYR